MDDATAKDLVSRMNREVKRPDSGKLQLLSFVMCDRGACLWRMLVLCARVRTWCSHARGVCS